MNLRNVLTIALSACTMGGVMACGGAKKPKQPCFPSIDGLSAEVLKTQCHKDLNATRPKTKTPKSLQGSPEASKVSQLQVSPETNKVSQPQYLNVDTAKIKNPILFPDDDAEVDLDPGKSGEVGLSDLYEALVENKK